MLHQRPRQLDDGFQIESGIGARSKSLYKFFQKFQPAESHLRCRIVFDWLLESVLNDVNRFDIWDLSQEADDLDKDDCD